MKKILFLLLTLAIISCSGIDENSPEKAGNENENYTNEMNNDNLNSGNQGGEQLSDSMAFPFAEAPEDTTVLKRAEPWNPDEDTFDPSKVDSIKLMETPSYGNFFKQSGDFVFQGNWKCEFDGSVVMLNGKGRFIMKYPGDPREVQGSAAVNFKKGEIYFANDPSEYACTTNAGIYKFEVKGNTISFTTIEDRCPQRAKLFSKPWKKI
jgi:hypothetical protein